MDYVEIMDSDHVGFFWQLHTDEYFGICLHTPPNPKHISIKLDRNYYILMFIDTIETHLEILELEQYLDQLEDTYIPELIKFVYE